MKKRRKAFFHLVLQISEFAAYRNRLCGYIARIAYIAPCVHGISRKNPRYSFFGRTVREAGPYNLQRYGL